MPELQQLADFHFLRPWVLWGLLLWAVLFLILRRRQSAVEQWKGVVAPHLLEHLVVPTPGRAWLRPYHLVFGVLLLTIFALAGPAWEREAPPFVEDTAPLVIALDLSPEMDAIDIQPSRVERAKQKIRDLIGLRPGARTGLLVYAGSAHMVLPLTDDAQILETYVGALSTELMPVKGNDAAQALQVAQRLLEREDAPGTILFITGGIPAEHRPALIEFAAVSDDQLAVLGVGTEKGGPIRTADGRFATTAGGQRMTAILDREGLEELSGRASALVTTVTIDDSDIRRLSRGVQSHLERVRNEDENLRWLDYGYYLVIPVALMTLIWFRRGFVVQWSAILIAVVLWPSAAVAQEGGFRFVDLWLTADQRGRYYFEKGDYTTAASRFADPLWKGLSYYKAADYESAITWFARLEAAEGYFNLGNAYARAGQYEEAVSSYEEVLRREAAYPGAQANLDLVRGLIRREEEAEDDEAPPRDPNLPPDEVQIDEKGKKGKAGRIEQGALSNEEMAELWMRRLETSPADFLRGKFAIQSQLEEKQ